MTAIDEADEIENGDYPEAGQDFAASVGEKLRDIADTIEEREHVTDKQAAAVENMASGISRWHDR